jgi:mRNA-degrading endonuclease RelE of RelBE toxin-antitoxin system
VSYRVKQEASGDACIAAQVNWYSADERRGGEALAKRWFARLHEALATLANAPTRHPFAPENGKWTPQLKIRQMLFRPWKSGAGWRVLFTIDEKQKLVTVLQIRHERRLHLHEVEEGED